MATWRLARSLVTLRSEINSIAPSRSKISDGTIGDLAHSSRASDHNPNSDKVVCAFDFTHDPANGCDAHKIADFLRRNRHPQIKYIISNGRIASAIGSWRWRAYTGPNSHARHVHVSVGEGPSGFSRPGTYDSTRAWGVKKHFSPPAPQPKGIFMGLSDKEQQEIYDATVGVGLERKIKTYARDQQRAWMEKELPGIIKAVTAEEANLLIQNGIREAITPESGHAYDKLKEAVNKILDEREELRGAHVPESEGTTD